MSRLERSYRRLLRLYPRPYRAHREEEVLAVLLDAAAPGQQRATARDAADLVLGAARARGADAAERAREHPAAAVGWGVLTVGLVVAALPASGPPPAFPESLPSRFAGYSYLTESASSSPPGPAVALYQQGWGVEFMDFPQAVVVGASGAYRRLDLAESRAGPETQGDPTAMLLSPDGGQVAVGDYQDLAPDVAVQDLSTGEVRELAVGEGAGTVPLAWSPDGRQLLVAVADEPLNPYAGLHGPDLGGRPVLLDLDTGAAEPLGVGGGAADVHAAAFSPDGSRVAVQHRSGQVLALDPATGAEESLGVTRSVLAGSAAWSPDGSLLAVEEQDCTGFLALDGDGATPSCVAVGNGQSFVGWAGPRRIAVVTGTSTDETGTDPSPLVVVDVDTQRASTVSGIDTGSANYAVSRLQVPGSALASGGITPAATADRGPWPPWLRFLTAAALAALTGRVTAASVVRTRRRRQRLAAVAPRTG